MRKFIALGAASVLLAVVAASASAGGNPNTLTLAVYGDSPYLDPAFATRPDAEFNATPAFINTINADPSVGVLMLANDGVHDGELWRSEGSAIGTALVDDVKPAEIHAHDLIWF